MKLIIDIDKEDYHRIASGFGQEEDALLLEKIFKNGTLIPNNATNGDVLKILYPNADLVGVCMVDKHMNVIFRDLNYHWLQSLYNDMAGLESEE